MKIRVEIKSGSNLPNAEWFTKSDPYCICEVPLGDSGPQQLTEQLRTKTVKNSLDPDWNFSQECDWDGENNLVFKVYDKDWLTPDDYLGRVEITRDDILGGMTLDDRPLEGKSGTVHRPGQIGPSLVVEVHYKILAGEGQTVRIDPRRGKIDYDAKAKVPMIKLKVALADGNWQVGARMRSSVVGAAMRSSACCKEPPCELAWCSSRGPRTEESQVQYNDAQGRTCLIKKNTAGNLDFFINNKLKVKQLKEVCIGIDHTVYFDGQKIAFPDSCSKVTDEDSTEKDRVIQEIRTLAGACQVMTNKKRCFVKVISGTGLRAADIGGKSDPYVICRVPGKAKSEGQTNFKSRTLSPQWHEILEIEGWDSGEPLEFLVMDHDYMSQDDFLGYHKLEGIDSARRGHPPEQDLKLVDHKEHGAAGKDAKGSIKVQVFIGGSESARPQHSKPKEAEETPNDKQRREMLDEVFKGLSTSSAEEERFPISSPAAAGDDKIGLLQVPQCGSGGCAIS